MAKNLSAMFGVAAAILFVASCADEPAASNAQAARVAKTPSTAARAQTAVADPARPAADRDLDPMRKPAAVLAFADIRPGDVVFEIEAGDGYYTEMMSRLVGPDGRIVMQNPPSFIAFLGDRLTARLADNRLPNVAPSESRFDALAAADASVDIVTWFLGPHELYFTPADGGALGDDAATFAEIARILKPDGVLVVLDHAASAGAPPTTGGALHRIDPAIVTALAESAGFELDGESDILRNPADQFDKSVFDPAVRRKTDRFLHRYVKK